MTVLRLGRTDLFKDKDSIGWNLGQNDKKEKRKLAVRQLSIDRV